jgi:hypothetical protein
MKQIAGGMRAPGHPILAACGLYRRFVPPTRFACDMSKVYLQFNDRDMQDVFANAPF